MPKKIIKKEMEDVISTVFFPKAMSISPLSVSFGNEDMNKVVEKINEIIARLNDVL